MGLKLNPASPLAPVVSLDTNIFLNALHGKPAAKIKAKAFLRKVSREKPVVYISVLVLEEGTVRFFRENKEALIPKLIDFLTAGGLFTLVELSRTIALRAAKIRADFPALKTPDAIHLATALEKKAVQFFTADKKLPGVEGLKVVYV